MTTPDQTHYTATRPDRYTAGDDRLHAEIATYHVRGRRFVSVDAHIASDTAPASVTEVGTKTGGRSRYAISVGHAALFIGPETALSLLTALQGALLDDDLDDDLDDAAADDSVYLWCLYCGAEITNARRAEYAASIYHTPADGYYCNPAHYAMHHAEAE